MTAVSDLLVELRGLVAALEQQPSDKLIDIFQVDCTGETTQLLPTEKTRAIELSLLVHDPKNPIAFGKVSAENESTYNSLEMYDEMRAAASADEDTGNRTNSEVSLVFVMR
jgi:hypothetical protein